MALTVVRVADFKQAEAALEPFVEIARHTTGKGITTERTAKLAAHVGNPQDSLKVVHVAGTSGKTSTCYCVAALLTAAKQKVGLTVSPHVVSIAERVQVGGKPLGEATFCAYLSEFLERIRTAPEMPTYFELMMVFAFWVFEKEGVDYAVVETGLGGLHDSSNIISSKDKVCIITDIGLDHTNVLGSSLSEITWQKAGIIWPFNIVLCHDQAPEIMKVIEAKTSTEQAQLVRLERVGGPELFLERNWRLAHEAFVTLQRRDGFSLPASAEIDATRTTLVPGRMEIFSVKGKTVVLDGAHNEQKMSTFLTSLEQLFPGVRPDFLVAFKRSKDISGPFEAIARHANRVIATEFSVHQDTPFESHDAEAIASWFTDREVVRDPANGLEKLLASNATLVVVTGSLYLVSEVRRLIRTNGKNRLY